jgi:hypothetical protein
VSIGPWEDIGTHVGMCVSDGSPRERAADRRSSPSEVVVPGMASFDRDRRRLKEIERSLREDDPRFARRFTWLGAARLVRWLVTFVAVCACVVSGLALVAEGARRGSWPVSVVGVALAVGVPVPVAVRWWRSVVHSDVPRGIRGP